MKTINFKITLYVVNIMLFVIITVQICSASETAFNPYDKIVMGWSDSENIYISLHDLANLCLDRNTRSYTPSDLLLLYQLYSQEYSESNYQDQWLKEAIQYLQDRLLETLHKGCKKRIF